MIKGIPRFFIIYFPNQRLGIGLGDSPLYFPIFYTNKLVFGEKGKKKKKKNKNMIITPWSASYGVGRYDFLWFENSFFTHGWSWTENEWNYLWTWSHRYVPMMFPPFFCSFMYVVQEMSIFYFSFFLNLNFPKHILASWQVVSSYAAHNQGDGEKKRWLVKLNLMIWYRSFLLGLFTQVKDIKDEIILMIYILMLYFFRIKGFKHSF